jgi:hypothetical protein
MASPVLAMGEELQTLRALKFSIVGSYGNSVHTGPPVSAYPCNSTVYPKGQTSLPVVDGQPMRYRDAPLLVVTTTDHPQGRNAFVDTVLALPALYILLL